MTRPWSLRRRLVRRVVLGACAAWLTGVGLAAFVISHEMSERMDDSLAGSARLALALYKGAGDLGVLGLEDSAIRIVDAGTTITDAPWPPVQADGGQDVPGWRVFRMSDSASNLVVEVGHTNMWRRDELRESLTWLVVLMLPVLLAAPIAIRGTVGSALRPATHFAEDLRQRSAQDLSAVTAPDLPTELASLPTALNAYLDVIRARIDAERRFANNAAHELRTPLAAASAQAQLMAAGLADGDAATRLAAACGRMGRLVERLLELSRAEAGMINAGRCDLVQVTRLVISEVGIPVLFEDGEIEQMPVAVDPDAMAMILRNLLANAKTHGTGDVRVVLLRGPELRISNSVGPDAQFRHAIFDKSAMSQGTGLGLAIVAELARAQRVDVDYVMKAGRATVALRFGAPNIPMT